MKPEPGAEATPVTVDHWSDPEVDACIHLLPGIGRPIGRCRISFGDFLAVGPCPAESTDWGRRRMEYWNGEYEFIRRAGGQAFPHAAMNRIDWFEGTGPYRLRAKFENTIDALRASAETGGKLLIWTSSRWSDQLFLFWLLDAAEQLRLEPQRFEIANVSTALSARDKKDNLLISVGFASDTLCKTEFKNRAPLSKHQLKAGAALWRKYTDPSPLEIDRVRRRGCPSFPEFSIGAEALGFMFPRASTRSPLLRLSTFDEMCLSGLSVTDWLTARDGTTQHWRCADARRKKSKLHPQPSHNRQSIADWLTVMQRTYEQFGDTAIHLRLTDWIEHSPSDPLLEWRLQPDPRYDWSTVAYRLTDRGERLIEEGLESAAVAPPMWVGGCQVYHPEECWVREDFRGRWRIRSRRKTRDERDT